MKKRNLFTLLFILFMAVPLISNAQIRKALDTKDILNDLNDTGDISLKDSDKKDYDKINRDFTDQLDLIDKSNKSDDDKDKAMDKLFDDRDKTIKNRFFKSDEKGFAKYQKKSQKKIKRIKRKAKINLAKAVL